MTGPPVAEGAVLIDGQGTIVAVGRRTDLLQRHPGAPEERGAGALLPGLVNAHCHLELSALAERVSGHDGLVSWVGRLMAATAAEAETATTASDRRAAAAHRAAIQMAAAGTAAIGDVGNSLDAVTAVADAGLRGVVFHELVGSRDARTGDALADAARELDRVADRWPPGVGYVVAPHAPYSAGPDLIRRIFAAAKRAGVPTSVHVAEDEDEIALLKDGSGRWPAVLEAMGVAARSRVPGLTPVAYLASLGAFDADAPPLLVHMVHAGAEDRRIAAAAGATAVVCARSNLHIGDRLPDVPALLADGVRLALGTDSLASSPDLSLWGELTTLARAFPTVPSTTWLAAATRAGADAMRLPALGALAPGRRPGVIDVSLGDPARPAEALVRDPRPIVRWLVRP